MIKRLVIVGLLFAVLFAGVAYFQLVFKPNMIKGFIAGAPKTPVAVTTAKVQQDSWVTRLPSIGTLTAFQGIDVSSQVGGIVSGIKRDSGGDVQEGTEILSLETTVEAADVASAQATLKQADVALKRAQDLTQRSVDPISTLDQARATRDTAAAALTRAQAVVAQKTIDSPFSGRLGIRKVDKGQYVSPGQALIALEQLDPIRADFPVPEQYYSTLSVGQPVQVTVTAWPSAMFDGKISALDARVASDTRTLLVRASFPNPDHRLLPGMFANVTVMLGKPEPVLTVPRTAVTYSLYGDAVYVVKPAAAPVASTGSPGAAEAATPSSPAAGLPVERRSVTTGEARDDKVAIISGLQVGEEVVTTGQIKLMPGVLVQVKNAETLQPPAALPKQ